MIPVIAIIAAVLVVVVAAVTVIVILVNKNKTGAETAKELANKLTDCIENEDTDGHYSLFEEEYLDYVMDDFGYTDKEVRERLEDNLLGGLDYIEDYTGKIESITIVDISVDTEKLDAEKKEDVKEKYGITASEYGSMEIEIEAKGKEDNKSMEIDCAVYKSSDRWYLYYWYIW